jgi:16S rRNA (cytosine1402-N4)-methyltransferase
MEFLNCRKGGVYVDATCGAGGHSKAILDTIGDSGRLIAFDWDISALEIAKDRLKDYKNIVFIRENFSKLLPVLNSLDIKQIDGIVFDLGLSSMQINDFTRGFSYMNDGPLDMRMDDRFPTTASTLLNKLSLNEIADIIKELGQERWARRIAKRIMFNRGKNNFKTTFQLAELVRKAVPTKRFLIKSLARVFQSFRMAVNQELQNLNQVLCDLPLILNEKARVVFISFHSLEDRMAKHFLKNNRQNFIMLVKKPLLPSFEESSLNPAARSAKLRAAEFYGRSIKI